MDAAHKHIDPIGLLPKVFSGEATPEESRLVDEWLEADPANRSEFDAVARLWNLTGNAAGSSDINLDAEWRKMEFAMIPAKPRTIVLTRIMQIAASVIVVSLLAFFGVRFIMTKSIKAPLAEQSEVSLPDGTKVSLNAASKLTYSKGFGLTHRNLRLQGEAYFEVKKNILPFTVRAGDASIRVTGTKFNVRAYGPKNLIRVTVTEGTVKLFETSDPTVEAIITAGETGTFDKSSGIVSKKSPASLNDLAWKTGIMDFQGTPLQEVADVLAGTYHVAVSIEPALQHCSITVKFENQRLDSVIRVLESTLDLTVTRKGRRISISGKGC